MRVTNSMLVSNFLGNLNHNLNKLNSHQGQLASGRKYANISDDPVSVIYSLQARQKLERLERYQKNVDQSQTWLMQGESAVMELNELVKSAYETVIDATTDGKTEIDRQNAAEYIKQLRDQVMQTANTTLGDQYIFGGYNTTGTFPLSGDAYAPFCIDAAGKLLCNGVNLTDLSAANVTKIDDLNSQKMQFSIAPGLDLEVSVTGPQLLGTGDDNVYKILDDLYRIMSSGTTTADDVKGFISEAPGAPERPAFDRGGIRRKNPAPRYPDRPLRDR